MKYQSAEEKYLKTFTTSTNIYNKYIHIHDVFYIWSQSFIKIRISGLETFHCYSKIFEISDITQV